jgi:hypothetical protein
LLLKRDDLIHPELPGNKWRKLKYNLVAAREAGASTAPTSVFASSLVHSEPTAGSQASPLRWRCPNR